ncbi:MAG TPA: TIGR01777 family protein [Acidimicrobiaceae bacterium]|nr:TIGR01777 family protein [Acidimicrobiaceae bacterium]
MRIVVSGATGFIGRALTTHLQGQGHQVVRLVRANPSGTDIAWNPAKGELPAGALSGAHAVVHLAGAGIGDHRWTDAYRKELLDSRVHSTTLLAEAIASTDDGPQVFLSGSAIGYYGASDDRELTEASPAGDDFLAQLCVQWEGATAAAAHAGARVALLRTGIVLGPGGGALKKMLPLFRFGLGGKFGNGRQWQSWVTLPDEVAAIAHLLTADVEGPVNLTAPNPVTNAEFTKVLAGVLKRPAVLPVPRFGPALLLGGALADALLYTGQRVLPTVLQGSGFEWQHPGLEAGLRAVLGK